MPAMKEVNEKQKGENNEESYRNQERQSYYHRIQNLDTESVWTLTNDITVRYG